MNLKNFKRVRDSKEPTFSETIDDLVTILDEDHNVLDMYEGTKEARETWLSRNYPEVEDISIKS